jgi:hypothetical protein
METLKYFMRTLLALFIFCLPVLFTACSSIEYNSTNSPKMVVVVDRTPFYHNGPAQGNGPDLSLVKGDEVEVLRKELGFSFVRIYDGQNGYVANEALRPAPPSLQRPSQKPQSQKPSVQAQPTFRY